RLQDVRTGREEFSLRGHRWPITQLAFAADGRTLISYSGRTVRVWDVERAPTSRRLPGHGQAARGVVFSPDGRWLGAGCADGRIQVYPWPAGGPVLALGEELP